MVTPESPSTTMGGRRKRRRATTEIERTGADDARQPPDGDRSGPTSVVLVYQPHACFDESD